MDRRTLSDMSNHCSSMDKIVLAHYA